MKLTDAAFELEVLIEEWAADYDEASGSLVLSPAELARAAVEYIFRELLDVEPYEGNDLFDSPKR